MRRLAGILAAVCMLTPLGAPTTATADTGRCPQYEPLLRFVGVATRWDVPKMSRTMWRESHCRPLRSRTHDSGQLQINDINLPYLSAKMHTRVTPALLMDPARNVWAGALLCLYWRHAGRSCYWPWNGGA